MNTLYANGSFEVRGIQQQAKSNPNLALTDEDYANLYIHEDATTRTPAPEIEIAPILTTTVGKHLSNDISTTDPTPGKENSIALPAEVKGIDRFIGITATDDPAPFRSAYQELSTVGRSRFTIMSDIANKGARKWLICRYVNSRHVGPESDPISFLVN